MLVYTSPYAEAHSALSLFAFYRFATRVHTQQSPKWDNHLSTKTLLLECLHKYLIKLYSIANMRFSNSVLTHPTDAVHHTTHCIKSTLHGILVLNHDKLQFIAAIQMANSIL